MGLATTLWITSLRVALFLFACVGVWRFFSLADYNLGGALANGVFAIALIVLSVHIRTIKSIKGHGFSAEFAGDNLPENQGYDPASTIVFLAFCSWGFILDLGTGLFIAWLFWG